MQFDYVSLPKDIKRQLDIFSRGSQQVVVRFPPEPSGYLHLGHVKALSLNYCIAKKYKGKLIVRLDDTNPNLESDEFERGILEDIKELNVVASMQSYTSDYFDQLMKYTDALIASANAYVDMTDIAAMRYEREMSIDSKYRGNTVEENIELWRAMKSGSIKSGCVRLKTGMLSKNKAMRDPAIYRPLDQVHHRTGSKYKVYPTYDFACPIVDSIEGVTHVFRSIEFNERDEMYGWIINVLNLRMPKLHHYGKINVDGAIMSKRKISELISSGKYRGWDDPRLYTLRGLINRGITFQSLDTLMRETGYPVSSVDIEPSTIWGINRKIVDKISTRYSAVSSDSICIEIDLHEGFPLKKNINKFVRNPSLGTREIHYSNCLLLNRLDIGDISDNEEVTLMNYGNAIYKDSKLQSKLDGDPKATRVKLIWVPKMEQTVSITIIDYDKDEGEIITKLVGEPSMNTIVVGDFIQLYKMDYYRCIKKEANTVTLIRIP
jgi:glutamyl-tRNA synthetase